MLEFFIFILHFRNEYFLIVFFLTKFDCIVVFLNSVKYFVHINWNLAIIRYALISCRDIYLSLQWRKILNRLISNLTWSSVSCRVLASVPRSKAGGEGYHPSGRFHQLGSSLVIKVSRERGGMQFPCGQSYPYRE